MSAEPLRASRSVRSTGDHCGDHAAMHVASRSMRKVTPVTHRRAVQVSFATGAAIPTLSLLIRDPTIRFWGMVAAVTFGLCLFGAVGALLGGFSTFKGGVRVLIGGWLAMAVTFGVGSLFGASLA
jgi:VIT1/CCC1 family predicted Fe2+/Mn2+ transporter